MTVEDSLARLRAGLDEDEVIARGAWKEGALHGDQWIVRKLQGGLFDGGIYVCDGQSPPQGEDISQTRDGETGHIERHDPSRVLRQAEAIRRVDAALKDLARLDHWIANDAREEIAEALASIYADPTEEKP